jgi:CHAT domain-containing protein
MLTDLLPKQAIQILEALPSEATVALGLSPDVEVLPWEWIVVNGEFLLTRNPVVRTPPGISNEARGYPAMTAPARVLLIGDPNEKDVDGHLPSARQEVLELQVLYANHDTYCDCLLGPRASFQALDEMCSGTAYDVIHFAGHAALDDEPFLLLSGPVKVHPDELRSVFSRNPPAILFLNTHFSMFVAPRAREIKAGGERNPFAFGQRGFVEAIATAGVGTLVGSFSGALQDQVARTVGVQFHKELLSGAPVARALHKARLEAAKHEGPQGVGHLSYSLSGYGDIVLPAQKS